MLDVFECRCPSRKPAGESVDQITLQDCKTCLYRPRVVAEGQRRLYLKNHLSPGDVLVMTAAIHSLHQAHPGEFLTAVDTTANALYEHNPDVTPLAKMQEQGAVETIGMHYPLINQCNQRAVHFMQGYCDYLADVLKIPVPLLTNKPMIYLSREEKEWIPQVKEKPYWLIVCGRKEDYTAKYAGAAKFQKIVDLLRGEVQIVQVGEKGHHHPPLDGVIDLVGKTDLRQLVRLTYHASGVVCGVTLLHHLAAALEKPSVVLMGGREPVVWNSYPKCQLLHTMGMLDCCRGSSCWKSRTVAMPGNDPKNASLCLHPVGEVDPVPQCLDMISAEHVAALVRMLKEK